MLFKGGFFFNLDVDNIPGFHEAECSLNVGVRLVCKICKQTTQKSPRETLMSPPGLLRHSKPPLELNHAADYIPGFHEVECSLNIIEANLLRDHRIEVQTALEVILRKQREIVAWQRIPAVANL